METKVTDERFYTPRSSARRGNSSGGSEDERFTSPRTSARSVSSDENEYATPRESNLTSPRDTAAAAAIHPQATPLSSDDYYKRAMGKSAQPSRLQMGEFKHALPASAEVKQTGRLVDEYKAQAFGGGRAMVKQPSFRVDSSRGGGGGGEGGEGGEMRSPRAVEAPPAVAENDVFSAARHNRIDSVAYMLDAGVSANLQDAHGNTVLSIACQNGLKRMAKLALRRGANINSQNHRGNTALHFCFAYGYGDSLGEYLISKGADMRVANDDGLTCFEGIDPRSPRK